MKIGNYNVLETLHSSSKTIVYLVKHIEEGSLCVAKLPNEEYVSIESSERLRREYELLRSLPESAAPLAVDWIEEKGQPAMLMSYSGHPLQMTGWQGHLHESVNLMIKMAQSLMTIHQAGIVHRDINPANILLGEDQRIRFIDFDLSLKVGSGSYTELGIRDAVEGTIAYLPPEQSGKIDVGIDYRSDYYALGATYYHFLTGKTPYSGIEDRNKLIHYQLVKKPQRLQHWVPELPEILSSVVLKLMEKNPEDRYQSLEGLLFDLEQIRQTDGMEQFVLGKRDVHSQFVVHNRFYGRVDDLKQMSRFASVANPQRVLWIHGDQGIGKTTLLKVFRAQGESHGYRAAYGLSSQQRLKEPYHGLIEALNDLISDLLLLPNRELFLWKERILEVLGSNAGVVQGVLPNLRLILDEQPLPILLGLEEARLRFLKVMFDFISIFSDRRKSLVICLDDAAHMDQATLELIAYIVDKCQGSQIHIKFILASKEMWFKERLSQHFESFDEMGLHPLDRDAVKLCLENHQLKLRDNRDAVEDIYKMTQGYPFSLYYLLRLGLDQNEILFNQQTGYYEINLTNLKHEELPSQIAHWMMHRLLQLDSTDQQLVMIAAVLGQSHVLSLLMAAASSLLPDESPEGILHRIQALQHQEILVLLNHQQTESQDDIWIRFVNDPMRMAALRVIEEQGQTLSEFAYHLAKMLMTSLDEAAVKEHSILLTELVERAGERGHQFSRSKQIYLNYHAALKTKAASAYDIAYGYLAKCKDLLNEYDQEALSTLPELKDWLVDVLILISEGACLQGHYEDMKIWIERARACSLTPVDERLLMLIEIKASIASGHREKALDDAIAIAKRYGVVIERQPKQIHILKALLKLRLQLGREGSKKLMTLPQMTDESMITVMEVMSAVASSAYLLCPELYVVLVLKTVELAIKHGESVLALNAYTLYGMILCGVMGQHHEGDAIAAVARKKIESMSEKQLEGRILVHSGLFVTHFVHSLTTSKQLCLQGYRAALDQGDYEYAAWGLFVHGLYDFFGGKPLSLALTQFEGIYKECGQLNQKTQQEFAEIFVRSIERLKQPDYKGLTAEEDAYLERIEATHTTPESSKFYFYLNQMLYCFLGNDISSALFAADQAKALLKVVISTANYPFYHYLNALIRLAHFKTQGGKRQQRDIQSSLGWLKTWVSLQPETRGHFVSIILAELAAIKGNHYEAIKQYNSAIEGSSGNGFVYEQAIACELAAHYYNEQKQFFISKQFLKRSESLYRKWGCIAKSSILMQQFSGLLSDFRKSPEEDGINWTTTLETGKRFDLGSIVQSTQALSTETDENQLMAAFMGILAENIGADKVLLFIGDEQLMSLKAIWEMDQALKILEGQSPFETQVESEDSEFYPRQVIQYVKRTQKEVTLAVVQEEARFDQDDYWQRHSPKSMLCMPMQLKGVLKGILYLENSLMANAFKSNQNEVIEIVMTQLAISLENSRLIGHLEEVVKDRTIKLRAISEQYKKLSITDQLTGLYNRRELDHRMTYEVNRIHRYGGELSVILMDLDHFKQVNDVYGHQAGDAVLITFANAIQTHVREQDLLGRWGGEEFMLICPETDHANSLKLAEKIRTLIEQTYFSEVNHLTVSLGVASLQQDEPIEALVKRADEALYAAKQSGRNRVVGG